MDLQALIFNYFALAADLSWEDYEYACDLIADSAIALGVPAATVREIRIASGETWGA